MKLSDIIPNKNLLTSPSDHAINEESRINFHEGDNEMTLHEIKAEIEKYQTELDEICDQIDDFQTRGKWNKAHALSGERRRLVQIVWDLWDQHKKMGGAPRWKKSPYSKHNDILGYPDNLPGKPPYTS